MAIPALKSQIQFVDAIIVMKAILIKGELKYKIGEVLKSNYATLQPDELVRADFSIFDLLGYKINDGQIVIGLLAMKKNQIDYDCIDFLPLENGTLVYAKDDASVREELTLDAFRALVHSEQKIRP